MITETHDGTIHYREQISPWARLSIGFLGLGCGTVIPLPFIIHADWTTPSWTLLLAVVCIVLPAALGLFFVIIALARTNCLALEPASRFMVRERRGPLGSSVERIGFDRIGPITLKMRDSEDGPYPILHLSVAGERRPMEIACFRDRADAEHWRSSIEAMIR